MKKLKAELTLDDVLASIRAYCMLCSGGSRKEVEHCHIKNCPLFPYRCVSAVSECLNATEPGQISVFDIVR